MRNVVKYLLALIGAGAVAGALYAYFSKKNNPECEEVELEISEEEDFDLDDDLEPVTNREYVTLNPAKEADKAAEEAKEEE